MNDIIRGTTPTISITFNTVATESIAVAYLTIKDAKNTLIEKNLASATVDEHSLNWTLTQEETLSLTVGMKLRIFCDWRLADGTRGRSNIATYNVSDSGKNEVI